MPGRGRGRKNVSRAQRMLNMCSEQVTERVQPSDESESPLRENVPSPGLWFNQSVDRARRQLSFKLSSGPATSRADAAAKSSNRADDAATKSGTNAALESGPLSSRKATEDPRVLQPLDKNAAVVETQPSAPVAATSVAVQPTTTSAAEPELNAGGQAKAGINNSKGTNAALESGPLSSRKATEDPRVLQPLDKNAAVVETQPSAPVAATSVAVQPTTTSAAEPELNAGGQAKVGINNGKGTNAALESGPLSSRKATEDPRVLQPLDKNAAVVETQPSAPVAATSVAVQPTTTSAAEPELNAGGQAKVGIKNAEVTDSAVLAAPRSLMQHTGATDHLQHLVAAPTTMQPLQTSEIELELDDEGQTLHEASGNNAVGFPMRDQPIEVEFVDSLVLDDNNNSDQPKTFNMSDVPIILHVPNLTEDDTAEYNHLEVLNRIMEDLPNEEPENNPNGADEAVAENRENDVLENEANGQGEEPLQQLVRNRKRSFTPSQWKANEAKRARNLGLEYTNKHGQKKPAVQMKLPCACRKVCRSKVSEEDRLKVHQSYWSLGDKDRQWAFIRAHSVSTPVAQKTTNQVSRRNNSRKYFFEIGRGADKTKVLVCKVMFMHTLSISDCVIQSAYDHVNPETKTPSPLKMGKHSNRPHKTTEAQKETIRTHINLYPRVPSHYVRARSKREYVETGLTIAKMCRHYKEWCVSESIPLASRATERQYRTVLNSEFNIGFFKPKKDQCHLCVLVKNGTRQEREKYKHMYAKHILNKKAARKEKTQAKNLCTARRDVIFCLFDLQKVLPCPKSEVSTFFYKNKLSVYNFTVFDGVECKALCYLWHAGIAKRGANEMASALFDYFSACAASGKKEIRSFSDNCSAQNKNRFLFSMFLMACAKFGIKIRHCYLESGHTQNEGDSVHGRIETEAQDKDIFTFDQWADNIRSAKVQEPMYEVKCVKRQNVFDFHDVVAKQNWSKDTNGNKITWTKVRVVEAGYEEEGILGIKYDFDGEIIYLNTKSKRGGTVNLKTYTPGVAYPGKIPLKAKTAKHLRELCESLAIPSKYHAFYEGVLSNVEEVEDDDPVDPQVEEDGIDEDDPAFIEEAENVEEPEDDEEPVLLPEEDEEEE